MRNNTNNILQNHYQQITIKMRDAIVYRLDFGSLAGEKAVCNLNCPYCHKDYFPISKSFDPTIQKSFVDTIKMLDGLLQNFNLPRKIHISGRIEPLTVDKNLVVDTIKSLKSYFPTYEIVMTTNGIKLEEFAEELIDAGVSRFNVSMHNKINPKSIIVRGMEKAAKYGARITLNVIITEYVINNMKPFIDFSKQNKYDLKFFYELGKNDADINRDINATVKKLNELLHLKGIRNTSKNRIEFKNGRNKIEVKLLENPSMHSKGCNVCKYKDICREGCWDSIRITPWYIKPCGVKEENVYLFNENSQSALLSKLESGGKIELRKRKNINKQKVLYE